jgi:hypothetical protein
MDAVTSKSSLQAGMNPSGDEPSDAFVSSESYWQQSGKIRIQKDSEGIVAEIAGNRIAELAGCSL